MYAPTLHRAYGSHLGVAARAWLIVGAPREGGEEQGARVLGAQGRALELPHQRARNVVLRDT